MKYNILPKLIILLVYFAVTSIACDIGRKEKTTYKAVGIVKEIDIEERWILVEKLEMEGVDGMDINYMQIENKESLGTLKIGDKIEFELWYKDSEVVATIIRKIGKNP